MDEDAPIEFHRLAHALRGLRPRPDVPLSVGDDGAHLRPSAPGGLIAVADMMVEGVHFRRAYTPPEALGHKILAVNLSDIAAMGATPAYALFTLAAPPSLGEAALMGIFAGLRRLADATGVALVGGDLTRAPEGALTASLTCLGLPGPVGPLTRRGAEVGDLISVVGDLGGAARALARLEAGERPAEGETWADPLRLPQAQGDAGALLGALGASALIDVSDGLLADLGHLLRRGVLGGPVALGATLDLTALPLSPHLAGLPAQEARAYALYGGEDYALLLTASPAQTRALGARIPLVTVGAIEAAPGVRFVGGPPPPGRGFTHFPEPVHG